MDDKTLKELRRECRRWWAVERRGMQVALANMETYRRAGKLTNDIKKDAIQWANERRRRMRLAAAARVGAAALANNSRVKQFVSSAGFGELEAAATQQSGAGGWRDSVTCPYCGHEHDCELRVKDVDFEALTLRVHGGKGDKDRLAQLPVRLVPMLRRWLEWRAALHANDVAEGAGYAELPGRLAVKYPGAARELGWQFVRAAVKLAGITKTVTPHTLRAAFATHALRCGNDLSTVQELMGHESAETTLLYVGADGARGVSPLDLGGGDMTPRRRFLEGDRGKEKSPMIAKGQGA